LIVHREISDSAMTRPGREARDGRIFALTLAGGFVFLGTVAYWRGRESVSTAAFSISALSLLAAAFVPARLRTIRTAWMKIGEAIGFLTTPIMMTLIYYVVITPIALVRRAIAKPRVVRDSTWQRRPPAPPVSRMERQF
jgi:hypothetical protein